MKHVWARKYLISKIVFSLVFIFFIVFTIFHSRIYKRAEVSERAISSLGTTSVVFFPDTEKVYSAINDDIGKGLAKIADPNASMLPFYMLVPMSANMSLKEFENREFDFSTKYPPFIIQYHQTDFSRPKENQVGLRIIGLNGKLPREQTATLLAKSGLIKTGDVILSYRPEWYRTLRYSHIQLGISHAGIAYIENNSKGEPTVFNLDMPLDESMIGSNQRSTLSAKHYIEAPYLHIIRPKNITDQQRANLLVWIKMLRDRAPKIYKSSLFFNTDYAAPRYDEKSSDKMGFVADLARLAYGAKINGTLKMYCSEFIWSILSLRNCNPKEEAQSFIKSTPTCITPPFRPLKTLGTITQGTVDDENRTLGMADGPLLIADVYTKGIAKDDRRNRMLQKLFSEAKGIPERISSGHRAVEASILESNPKFFDYLLAYYKMTALPLEQRPPEFDQIFNLFNAGQKSNYSPTSFQIHAILPETEQIKAMDYVGTLFYLPEANYNKVIEYAVKVKK